MELDFDGLVDQRYDRRLRKPEVAGSNPAQSTIIEPLNTRKNGQFSGMNYRPAQPTLANNTF